MPRGARDYSNVIAGENLNRLDDMSELVIRQGHPASVDRLGYVVLMDTFQYGILGVQAEDGGLGSTVSASPLYSHYGGYTIALERAANLNAYAGFTMRTMAREAGKVGVEVLFSAYTAYPNCKLYVIQRDGTNFTRFGLRWDGNAQKAYIGGDTEGWEETGSGLRMLIDYPIVHSMKLVGDFENNEYSRAFIDGTMLTLVDKDPYTAASAQADNVQLSFYNGAGYLLASEMYVDVAIITQDEP